MLRHFSQRQTGNCSCLNARTLDRTTAVSRPASAEAGPKHTLQCASLGSMRLASPHRTNSGGAGTVATQPGAGTREVLEAEATPRQKRQRTVSFEDADQVEPSCPESHPCCREAGRPDHGVAQPGSPPIARAAPRLDVAM